MSAAGRGDEEGHMTYIDPDNVLSSSDEEEASVTAEDHPPAQRTDSVSTFLFSSPLLPPSTSLTVAQPSVAGEIGFKLYPAALLLSGLLEDLTLNPTDPVATSTRGVLPADFTLSGAHVLELGAGVSGLVSMVLSRTGAHAYASDLPPVLPELQANLDLNKLATTTATDDAALSATGSATSVALPWGDDAAVVACLTSVLERQRELGQPETGLGLVVAADVVYQEALSDLLLGTLTTLVTQHRLLVPSTPPPPIHITYVNRFKKSKRFFQQARRRFRVVPISLPDLVTDYELLNFGWRHSQLEIHSGFPRKPCFLAARAKYGVEAGDETSSAAAGAGSGSSGSGSGSSGSSGSGSDSSGSGSSKSSGTSCVDEPKASGLSLFADEDDDPDSIRFLNATHYILIPL